MLKHLVVLLLVFLSLPTLALSSDADSSQPESLTDLLYMGVSVASKKSENIHEAAGIISVITNQEIRSLPAKNLYEVMLTIPGVTVTESFFGFTTLAFRGVKETHYNNRTLLLLNGQPLRDVIVGTHWLEAVPINVIDKIEIIRGPGSVLYGTGAFAGVINVLTKKNIAVADVTVKAGSQSTVDASATWGQRLQDFNFLLGGSWNESQGYPADVMDETGLTARMGSYDRDPDAYEDDYYNLYGNVGFQDYALDVYHFRQEKDKFGLIPNHRTTGEAVLSSTGGSLHYSKDFHGWDLSAQVRAARSSYDSLIGLFPPTPAGSTLVPSNSAYELGTEIDANIPLIENLSLGSGLSYEYLRAQPYEWTVEATGQTSPFSTFLRDYETYNAALYSQLEYKPVNQVKITAGLRFNHNRDYGETVVPRGSVVFTARDNIFVKLLYGQAYRDPTFFEKYVNTQNVLYGDPDLQPEKIETLEISTDWLLSAAHELRLTLFTLSTDDMIGRVVTYQAGDIPAVILLEDRGAPTAPTRNTPGYGNAVGQQIHGVEFEIKGDLRNPWLSYALNASYKEGKEKSDWSPIQFLDQIVVNGRLTHRISQFTNTLSLNWVGERRGNISNAGAAPGFTPGQEITVPAFVLLNLKSTVHVIDNLDLSLSVFNLLGQKVEYPEYIRRIIATIPGDSQTTVFGEATYRF